MPRVQDTTIDRLGATLALDEPVTTVRMVSPKRAQALAKIGISTVRDLVCNYPRRYVDMSRVARIAEARIGESLTIRATVHEVKLKRPKPRLPLTEIAVADDTGTMIITAFRQPWLADQLKPGMNVAVSGKVEFNFGFKRMTNPYIEVLDDDALFNGTILSVFPSTGAIKQGMMRRLVANALEEVAGVVDPLPLLLRVKYRLMSKDVALRCISFPSSMDEQSQARRRLAYEEVLLLQLVLMQEGRKRSVGKQTVSHEVSGPKLAELGRNLPFELTGEQASARDEILGRMADSLALNHMLLGDVGTGKTIVSAFALAAAADSGHQALFMAPTEILAQQHAASLGPLLAKAGVSSALLSGSTADDERDSVIERLASGDLDVLFGTHALLEPDVVAKSCSLVVIDEQQRFGVEQRAALIGKGVCPDVLFLTATPIPRTLALALFGNLTLSYIRERPHDAAARTTYLHAYQDRGSAYDAALSACRRGEQAYVVCPLVGEKRVEPKFDKPTGFDEEEAYEFDAIAIEDERDMAGGDAAAAEQEAEFLQAKVFVDYKVGLMHGKLASAEKQRVMDDFRDGRIDVLVATTVIEVGVDVPNATVMIIEDADRFGLSQLHQLRGRVGRGGLPAEVHLVSGTKSETALQRLAAMEKTDDGFKLASYDLSLRREGDILGNRQHGASLLKLVNVVRDSAIIEAAHEDAQAILDEDPLLELEANRALAREARVVYRSRQE